MEERTIKRSIRIPIRLHEVLEEESKKRIKSVNQVILEELRKDIWNRSRRKKKRTKVVLMCIFMK